MKKNKSSSNLIGSIIGFIALVLLVIPMFVSIYTNVILTKGTGYGLFNDWSLIETIYTVTANFNSTCTLIIDILAIVLLVLAALYIVVAVLQMAKVIKVDLAEKIKKLISLVAGVCVIVLIICAIVLFSGAKIDENNYLTAGAGFYLMVIGGALLTVSGFVKN